MSAAEVVDERTEQAVSRAIGGELRGTREARGWSRPELVERLPSGIGERTLLSYEHGMRRLSVARFVEICHVLDVDPATVLRSALQKARLHLEKLTLDVDLKALVSDSNVRFRPMVQWARNTLNDYPDGITEVEPAVVKHLAYFVGCTSVELSRHLARFAPDVCPQQEAVSERPQ